MSGTFFTFALSVLPALLGLGVTSYSRLADLAVHDAYYARAIGRIRAFYLTIEPAAAQYWLQPAGDDAHTVMRQAGQPHSRWHHLGHTATSVAVVVGVIGGVFLGLLGSVATALTTPVLAAGAVAVVVVAALLADQEQRWRRFEGSMQSLFLPDCTPRCPRPRWVKTPRRVQAWTLSPVWPERTAPGQSAARSPAEPEHINSGAQPQGPQRGHAAHSR
jgi:hypothetical protein